MVYEEDLSVGLRFPLHPFFQAVMHRYRIVPVQLGPNSFHALISFVLMCRFLGIDLRLSLF